MRNVVSDLWSRIYGLWGRTHPVPVPPMSHVVIRRSTRRSSVVSDYRAMGRKPPALPGVFRRHSRKGGALSDDLPRRDGCLYPEDSARPAGGDAASETGAPPSGLSGAG